MRRFTDIDDLLLIRPGGEVAAAIEVKVRPTPEQWERAAEQVRRTAADHDADYAALLTADRLTVWSTRDDWSAEGDAEPLMRPFLKRAGVRPERVGSGAFQMLAMLASTVFSDPRPETWGEGMGEAAAHLRETAPRFAEAIIGADRRPWDREEDWEH